MNTKIIVIYNIIGFIGSGGILLSTVVSKKGNIMKTQTAATAVLFVADLLAKGYSGAAQDIIGVIRNITVMKNIHKKWLSLLFIASGLLLGIFCNNQGLVGFLPIFANFQFSCIVLKKDVDEILIKLSVCASNICWGLFNFHLMNYANMAVNVAICTSAVIFVVREIMRRKKAISEADA